MLNLGDDVHEISLKFTYNTFARNTHHPFWNRYSTGGNKAEGWPDILPQLEAAFELSEFSTLIVGFILFVVVTLSIINTLFMSLYERMYEFGVMRAVGTSGAAIARLVVFEAAATGVCCHVHLHRDRHRLWRDRVRRCNFPRASLPRDGTAAVHSLSGCRIHIHRYCQPLPGCPCRPDHSGRSHEEKSLGDKR